MFGIDGGKAFLLTYDNRAVMTSGGAATIRRRLIRHLFSAVRHWKEVSCVKSPELQLVLLEAREKEGAPVQTVLPLPVHWPLSHKR